MWIELILLGIGLGVSLAMDAFSVSLANGLNEPKMKKSKLFGIAGIFAGFQFLMPVLGWLFVSLFVEQFKVFEKFIPWIALGLLGFIGGKMLYEGIKNKKAYLIIIGGVELLIVIFALLLFISQVVS